VFGAEARFGNLVEGSRVDRVSKDVAGNKEEDLVEPGESCDHNFSKVITTVEKADFLKGSEGNKEEEEEDLVEGRVVGGIDLVAPVHVTCLRGSTVT